MLQQNSVSSAFAVLSEVGLLAVARVRVILAESWRGWVPVARIFIFSPTLFKPLSTPDWRARK